DQITSMKSASSLTWPASVPVHGGSTIAPPAAIVVNGDITSFWSPNERQFWVEKRSSFPNMPILFGLGNHDLLNNLCDCHGWVPWDSNSCSRNALITSREIFRPASWLSYDNCSVAYSFDLRDFHFAQLNISPSTEVNTANPGLGVCPS